MPELPEVETVRRGLEPVMLGKRIERVRILDPRLVQPASPQQVARMMRGRTVEGLGRRGKYLLIELEGDAVAIHHLRMTGSFSTGEVSHERARYELEGGAVVRYRDPRRFGTLVVLPRDEAAGHLAERLGPEPLGEGFGAEYLWSQLRRRRAPLKAVLLDQKVVAGLGNIYVDEALHQARMRPGTRAERVRKAQVPGLVEAIRDRLEVAIAAQGSTLRDYRGVEGSEGGMQERFQVYGRTGGACLRCGGPIKRDVIAGRGTWWCPSCQRP